MSTYTFADVVHQSIAFSTEEPSEDIILKLIDTKWFQRLRDVSQTANTRLVYMFSEHSRFGHCLGVAFLANRLMTKLAVQHPSEVQKYRVAVSAAAMLHDCGHLAPGSHMAFRTWFPGAPDTHEQIALEIIRNDPEIREILDRYGKDLADTICAILEESDEVPAWTWEIISGGGWNVDRGNWCVVDSILAGVSYGEYNIPAITDSIVITDSKHLALRENRLDAMMHFAVSRHAMYRQLYQHRVLLAADTLSQFLVKRARELEGKLPFADDTMQAVLAVKSPEELKLDEVFKMRESWWRYHITRWSESSDSILADISSRIINRKLLKTIRIKSTDNADELTQKAKDAITQIGLDPDYYLSTISTKDVHAGDSQQSMLVMMDDGRTRNISDVEPLFSALVTETKSSSKTWLALPAAAKELVGRKR